MRLFETPSRLCSVTNEVRIDAFTQKDAVNVGEEWSLECRSTAINKQWVAKWVDPHGVEVPILSNGADTCDSTNLTKFVTMREGTETSDSDNNKQFKELTLHLCNVDESFSGNYTCSIEGGETRVTFLQVGTTLATQSVVSGGIAAAVTIIIVLLVGIAVVIVLVLIVVVHSRRKDQAEFDARDSEDMESKQGEPQAAHSELVIPMDVPDGKGTSMALPVDEKWQFPSEQLHILRDLGSGQFGKVHVVHAPGILSTAPHKKLAAAKTVKGVCVVYTYVYLR